MTSIRDCDANRSLNSINQSHWPGKFAQRLNDFNSELLCISATIGLISVAVFKLHLHEIPGESNSTADTLNMICKIRT